MDSIRTQNRVMSTINELADFIRKNAPVRFGKVAVTKHIAPSTLYGYIKILLDLHDDITYQRGTFFVEKHHRMPNGKLVPQEK